MPFDAMNPATAENPAIFSNPDFKKSNVIRMRPTTGP
jgi:hypothetical protein